MEIMFIQTIDNKKKITFDAGLRGGLTDGTKKYQLLYQFSAYYNPGLWKWI